MTTTTRARRRAAVPATLVAAAALIFATGSPAQADPIGAGSASAFGATLTAGGEEVVPPTPAATVTLPPGGEASETLVDIPAEPLAVSGTLTANAAVHPASDLESALTVVEQEVPGPYNATGEALVEGLDVLLDQPEPGVSLLTADVVRSEAVAVCVGDAVQYSANSEIINLQIAGEEIPLNAPLQDLIDGIGTVLEESGLNAVVDVQRNVVTPTDDGIGVDALVVTLLAAAGEEPLAELRIAHAEVSAVACGDLPECSDGEDNDGDGFTDFSGNDPGCDSAEDDSEADAPECSDGTDNDGDGFTDFSGNDPGCDSAEDDSELDDVQALPRTDPAQTLPRTGSNASTTAGLAGLMAAGALGLGFLRHRMAY